jgi:hypothetical protein
MRHHAYSSRSIPKPRATRARRPSAHPPVRTRRRDGVRVPTTLHFLGLVDDVAVARDVYRSASTVAPRLAKAYSAARVESWLMEEKGLSPLPPRPDGRPRSYRFRAEERRWAHRELQTSFLNGFLEGLRSQFREQVAADASLAVLLTIHPLVQERYMQTVGPEPFEYEPPPSASEVAGMDEAAWEAGSEAGRSFRAEPTRRLGEGTPRLPEQH